MFEPLKNLEQYLGEFDFNSRVPFYNDSSDYTTNAPSYYDDLARKNKLIKHLALRIWDYDKEMVKRLEQWDKNLEDFPDDVKKLLEKWLSDGTLEHIINYEIFGKLNDRIEVVEVKTDGIYINIREHGGVGDGITDDTQAFKSGIAQAESEGKTLYIPAGTYKINESLKINKTMRLLGEQKSGTVLDFSGMEEEGEYALSIGQSGEGQIMNFYAGFFTMKGHFNINGIEMGARGSAVVDSQFQQIRIEIFNWGLRSFYTWMNTFTNCRIQNTNKPFELQSQTNATHFDTCSFATFKQTARFVNAEGIVMTSPNIANCTADTAFSLFQSTVLMLSPYSEHIANNLAIIGGSSEAIPSSLKIESGITSGSYVLAGYDNSLHINIPRATRIGGNPNIKIYNVDKTGVPRRYTKNIIVNLNDYSNFVKPEIILDYNHANGTLLDNAFGGGIRRLRLFRDYVELEQETENNGFTLTNDLELDTQYTLVYAIRKTAPDQSLTLQAGDNSPLFFSESVLNHDDEWELRYIPFVATANRLRLGVHGTIQVKTIKLIKGIANSDFKLNKPTVWTSSTVPHGEWKAGDVVLNRGNNELTMWKRLTNSNTNIVGTDWLEV